MIMLQYRIVCIIRCLEAILYVTLNFPGKTPVNTVRCNPRHTGLTVRYWSVIWLLDLILEPKDGVSKLNAAVLPHQVMSQLMNHEWWFSVPACANLLALKNQLEVPVQITCWIGLTISILNIIYIYTHYFTEHALPRPCWAGGKTK